MAQPSQKVRAEVRRAQADFARAQSQRDKASEARRKSFERAQAAGMSVREIAKEMGMPLATVRQRLTGLAATGAVITCNLTRFEGGKRIDAWQCRVSGYIPPVAPGRKAKRTT